MEHNRDRMRLKDLIANFIAQRGLPFTVSEAPSFRDECSVIYYDGRCRALIWDNEPPSIYGASGSLPYVTIYDVDPEKSYTALGDRRCDLSAAHPEFFEQLEHHLLLVNATI